MRSTDPNFDWHQHGVWIMHSPKDEPLVELTAVSPYSCRAEAVRIINKRWSAMVEEGYYVQGYASIQGEDSMKGQIQAILKLPAVMEVEAKINDATREVAMLTQQKRLLITTAFEATGIVGRRVKFGTTTYEVVGFRDAVWGELQLTGRKIKKDNTPSGSVTMIPMGWGLVE